MTSVGIIAEYNPLHNGHVYHIQEAKKRTGADYVIVIMSGNFVQRGAPAIVDKYIRTKTALLEGADLVIELPSYYATSSAQYFARGAIYLLHKMGVLDFLCFSSECGDLSSLSHAACLLEKESTAFKHSLHLFLKKGYSFPMPCKVWAIPRPSYSLPIIFLLLNICRHCATSKVPSALSL